MNIRMKGIVCMLTGLLLVGCGNAGIMETKIITQSEAESIAITHAGVEQNKVTIVRNKLDEESGRQVYDVEFYVGNVEYDYEIDATTGKVLANDSEIETELSSHIPSSTEKIITQSEAESIAITHAGVEQNKVTIVRNKLDEESGRQVYDVEFYVGNVEYDYEIDATSRTVIGYDVESR